MSLLLLKVPCQFFSYRYHHHYAQSILLHPGDDCPLQGAAWSHVGTLVFDGCLACALVDDAQCQASVCTFRVGQQARSAHQIIFTSIKVKRGGKETVRVSMPPFLCRCTFFHSGFGGFLWRKSHLFVDGI